MAFIDCQQSFFSLKIHREDLKTSKPVSMTGVWRARCKWQCHEPLEAQAWEDEQRERLQWFHTTIWCYFDRSHQWHLPVLNMTLRCLIFYANLPKLYSVRCDEWFHRLQLKPGKWLLKNVHTASQMALLYIQKQVWSIKLTLKNYWVTETLVKVWGNLNTLCKHLPMSHVLTAFLVLPNFHQCYYNLIETWYTCIFYLLVRLRNLLPFCELVQGFLRRYSTYPTFRCDVVNKMTLDRQCVFWFTWFLVLHWP